MHDSLKRLLECAARTTAAGPAHLRITGPGDLARALDTSPQTVTNWKKRGVSQKASIKAGELFGCTAAWILEGTGSPPHWSSKQHLPAGDATRLRAQDLSQGGQYAAISRPTRVPVHFRCRPQSSGELQVIDRSPAGSVESTGVSRDAFAVRIDGDDLFPALRHGMFVLCDPAAPCVQGEWVLVELHDGTMHVRELLYGQAEEIATSSVLGGHRKTVARSDVKRITAVVGTAFNSRWAAITP